MSRKIADEDRGDSPTRRAGPLRQKGCYRYGKELEPSSEQKQIRLEAGGAALAQRQQMGLDFEPGQACFDAEDYAGESAIGGGACSPSMRKMDWSEMSTRSGRAGQWRPNSLIM